MERAPATLQAYLLPWVRVLFCLQYQRGLTETASRRFFRTRRDGRVVEGARLESVYRGNSIEGSNPSLSATSTGAYPAIEPRSRRHAP